MMKTLRSVAIAGSLLAQAPPAADEPFVVRSTTKLVQVNVVAVDGKGNPVQDLKAEDFQLTDEGKQQKISFFGVLRSNALAAPPAVKQQNVFSNTAVAGGLPTSVTVILLDGLNTDWTDQARARDQVLRFLSTIEPEDRIALYSLGTSLRVLHDFTSDTSELIQRLKLYRGEFTPATAGVERLDRLPSTDPLAQFMGSGPPEMSLQEQASLTANRVDGTLRAMEAIAAHIAAVPGRKSLVWVSGGFPILFGFDGSAPANQEFRSFGDDLSRTVRLLNHAGVAVYPVDARGLMAPPPNHAPASGIWRPPNLDSMLNLATRTGGRAFYNRNDIDGAVRRAADDGKVTYTLAYYPSGSPDGKYHDIKLKVTRPGVTLRHRKGYFAYDEVKASDADIKRDMSQALWAPLDATTIALNARVDHNAKTGQLEVFVQVDPAGLTLERRADRWNGRVDFVLAQRDATGKSHATAGDVVQLNLRQDRVATMFERGLLYRKVLPRHAEATTLRIVVRDGRTGYIGTVTAPLREVATYTPAEQPAAGAARPK